MHSRCGIYFMLMLQFYGTELRQMKNGALRVIGGRNSMKGEFPYVVRMQVQVAEGTGYDFIHLCTCSLLNPTWSLTAAHCIDGLKTTTSKYPETKGVLRYDLSSQDTRTSLILHSVKYSSYLLNLPSRLSNDIGLLRSQEVPLRKYAKLSSVDFSTLFGHQALALGYGWTMDAERINYNLNSSLQVLDVITVKCSTIFSKSVTPSLCLTGLCGQWSTICPGDSGGPILHPSGLVGINTAVDSRNCNKELSILPTFKLTSNAGIATPVSPFLDWIAKIIQ